MKEALRYCLLAFLKSFPNVLLLAILSGCLNDTNEVENKEHIEANGSNSGAISTNLFDLNYQKIFHIDIKKQGGAIAHTDDELLVMTGDGAILILDLKSDQLYNPRIQLPDNNQKSAIKFAEDNLSPDRATVASKNVEKYLRYDDILVFSKDGKHNIIASYSHFNPINSCFSHRISKLTASASVRLRDIEAKSEDWSDIFISQPCFAFKEKRAPFSGHESGGRIDLVDSDSGRIVLALGHYGFDGVSVADYPQDPKAAYGKVWMIDTNTHASTPLSIGHRNTQGITVDSGGSIWTVEHGPQGGDELNLIREGSNFGWPKVILGIHYGNQPWPLSSSQNRHKGFDYPIYAWVPSIATSNIDQSQGFHPFWEGDLLVFTLRTSRIHRLRIHDSRVIFDERINLGFNQRIRYGLNHTQTGALYLWTDKGNIYRVIPSDNAWSLLEKSERLYSDGKNSGGIITPRQQGVLDKCIVCHSGKESAPPKLNGLLGGPIAEGDYDNYSKALLNRRGEVWNKKSIKEFLRDVQEFAPGTSMPDPGFIQEAELDSIIAALQSLE